MRNGNKFAIKTPKVGALIIPLRQLRSTVA